ncbi:MAG: helix-turn-helix transcriptional regulator [Clostridia bacterium]|nr:helix-turn-helix transcriptional regulator [Clostridia bacterium]
MKFSKLLDSEGKYFYYEIKSRKKIVMPTHHYHDVFEIYFLEKGDCRYFIDDKCYEVKSGDIILIPKGIIHQTMYGETEHVRKLINCSSHYIPTQIVEKLPSIIYHYRNEEITNEIKNIFNKIEREFISSDEYSDGAILNYTHLLFYLLARNENKIDTAQKGNLYVTEVISFLKENFVMDVSLSKIADKLSISIEHLSRIFKKETGFTFIKYLNMLRFQKAETLLKSDEKLSITEIAYRSGFNDSNYFSDKFKKYYGVSPLRFKKNSK